MIVDNTSIFNNTLPNNVYFWDETLRDGEQSPGVHFSIEEKVEIACLLDSMGVQALNVGFPIISENEFNAVREIASLGLNARVAATVRLKKEDIDHVMQTGVKDILLFLPSSQLHLHHKFGLTEIAALDLVISNVKYAIEKGLKVTYVAEDSTRSDINYLIELFNLVHEAGTETVMITDTLGVMNPTSMYNFVKEIKSKVPKSLQLATHCHNDFGLATANTLAAIEAGVQYASTTVNGIGERSGNAAFEEVVMSLEKLYGHSTGIKKEKLNYISSLIERKTGMIKAPNKAIVGFNSFRHESGIHLDAMLKMVETYEPFSPEEVGGLRTYVFGKHSGKKSLKSLLEKGNGKIRDELIDEYIKILKEYDGNNTSRFEIVEQVNSYYMESLGISEKKLLDIVKNHELGNY